MAPYRGTSSRKTKRKAPRAKARAARKPARRRKGSPLGALLAFSWMRNNPDMASLAAVLSFGIGGALLYSQIDSSTQGRFPASSMDLEAAPAEHRRAHNHEHSKHLRCNVFLDHGQWDSARPF
jgi:hypothetical protein